MDWQALSPIAGAVGWTILHSLWQITLLAFSLAFALRFVSRKRAALRYGILLAGLGLAPATSGITFAWLWPGAAPAAPSLPVESAAAELVLLPEAAPAESDALTGDGWQALAASLDAYTPHIAIVWVIGMFAFLIYLLSGLFYLKHLQQHQVQAPDPAWENRFRRLCRQIGVSGKVQLLLSGKVSEPITFRLFRPVILVPFSLFTGLTTAQIEVLLLHELAHIRRYDFVINLLQTLIEMLFFYHPALWWISGKIREEREHCCDDLVMAVQRNPVLYAEALTQLQAHQFLTKKRLAMSATGKKSLLSKRVFRLFGQYEEQPSIFKSLIMALLLLGISFSAQGFFDQEKPQAGSDWSAEVTPDLPEAPEVLLQEAFEGPNPGELRASPGRPNSAPPRPEAPAADPPDEVFEIAPVPAGEERPLPRMTPLPALQNLAGSRGVIESIHSGRASLWPARDSLPLYVIDGKVIGAYQDQPTLESIDPNDIESISVLKGESAVEKYGDSGAFGVIEIRTKGKAGENKQIRVRGPVKVRAAPAEKANDRSGLVSGKVIGENQEPLIGATVLIQGTNIGTVTDLEGNYRLELPDECATLIISYVGRKTAVVQNACRDQQVGVVLEEEAPATETRPASSGPARVNLQAYPNPSEGQVNIEFHLEKAARVQLGIYGLDGKLLQQLVDGELPAGPQKAIWQGNAPAKGVYLIQLQIEGSAFGTISRKVVME